MPRRWFRHALFALMGAALFSGPAAEARAAGIERVGEKLFLVRDKPGTPTHFQMIVQAGCSDEADGQCRGLAHYLEHLVLVGRNPEHQESAIRLFAEGYSNGWTNDRATAYVHRAPPRVEGPRVDLERFFGFYAARLRDFSVSDQDAERERRVVLQEHDQRFGGRPFSRFSRALDRDLLPDHPAGQWTIGTPETIGAFTLDAARAFHQRWYVPGNVYFAVRGDVEPALLKEIADRALGPLANGATPPREERPVTNFSGRIDRRAGDAQVRQAAVFYRKLVAIPEPDELAGRAARLILSSFLASRLAGSPYEELVEKQKVAASPPSFWIRRIAPGVFSLNIGADAAPDVAPDALLAAIEAYVARLGDGGPSAALVERLKTRFARERELADQDEGGVYSRLVGWLADRNSFETLALWPGKVAAVTPEDVVRLSRALAGEGRVVTGILAPVEAAK